MEMEKRSGEYFGNVSIKVNFTSSSFDVEEKDFKEKLCTGYPP
jgi:hypothetical protein